MDGMTEVQVARSVDHMKVLCEWSGENDAMKEDSGSEEDDWSNQEFPIKVAAWRDDT